VLLLVAGALTGAAVLAVDAGAGAEGAGVELAEAGAVDEDDGAAAAGTVLWTADVTGEVTASTGAAAPGRSSATATAGAQAQASSNTATALSMPRRRTWQYRGASFRRPSNRGRSDRLRSDKRVPLLLTTVSRVSLTATREVQTVPASYVSTTTCARRPGPPPAAPRGELNARRARRPSAAPIGPLGFVGRRGRTLPRPVHARSATTATRSEILRGSAPAKRRSIAMLGETVDA
jgi:hypothetical protein